jgi:hypothetical protein
MTTWRQSRRITMAWRILAALALSLMAVQSPRAAHALPIGLCYVNVGVIGGLHNGSSWADAYNDLHNGLGNGLCLEIWVASGVYRPDASNPDVSFSVPPGRAIYGGFVGNETLLGQRDWRAHLTILSGDLENNDTNADGNHIDESYTDIQGTNSVHVVWVNGLGATKVLADTRLDGFIITGGSAGDIGGGGLFCAGSGAGKECSPTLSNLTFSGNQAPDGMGGAVLNSGGSGGVSNPTLQSVTFKGNRAYQGGGLYNAGYAGNSSPSLVDVIFESNSAALYGGAVVNSAYGGGTSSPLLLGVTFSGNTADDSAGAMLNSGGDGTSSPDLINVTFSGNHAALLGGALFNSSTTGTSSPTVLNSTFQGNSAANAGGGIYSNAGAGGTTNPTVYGVILWGNTATFGSQVYNSSPATAGISYSVVQGGCGSIVGANCSGGHNLDTDPLLGPLWNNGGYDMTMALLPGSPAIDAGSTIACPSIDQRRAPRPMDGNHDGTAVCDIGAFEASMFADVPVLGKEWMEPWIEAFYYAGVTSGCGLGPLIYCPENNVTRAEMAVFLLRAKHGAAYVPPAATHTFTDVPVAG